MALVPKKTPEEMLAKKKAWLEKEAAKLKNNVPLSVQDEFTAKFWREYDAGDLAWSTADSPEAIEADNIARRERAAARKAAKAAGLIASVEQAAQSPGYSSTRVDNPTIINIPADMADKDVDSYIKNRQIQIAGSNKVILPSKPLPDDSIPVHETAPVKASVNVSKVGATKNISINEGYAKTLRELGDLPADVLVFDFETTGLNTGKTNTSRPVELAYSQFRDGKFVKESQTYLSDMAGNEDVRGNRFLQHIGITQEKLNTQGIDYKKAITEFGERLEALTKEGTFITGHNVRSFDMELLRNTYETLNPGKTLNIDSSKIIDTGVLFKGVSQGTEVIAGDTLESFENRAAQKKVKGWKLEDAAKALGVEFDPAKAHSADYDVRKTGEVYQKMRELQAQAKLEYNVPEAIAGRASIAEKQKLIEQEAKTVLDNQKIVAKSKAAIADAVKEAKTNKALKGFGFWTGAGLAVGAYSIFGRSPLDETMEKIGGKQDSPMFDAMVAGGAAFGINRVLRHQKAFPNLIAMFNKALEDTPPIKTYKSQLFKLGGVGLAGYSVLAIGHNIINNEPGEGWRYPLLTAGMAGAAVYSQALYNSYNGDLDELSAGVHKLYQEKIVTLKDTATGKNLHSGWKRVVDGKAIAGDSPTVKGANKVLAATARSGFGKFAIGAGIVAAGLNLLTGSDNGKDSEPVIQTGNDYQSTGLEMDNSYNHTLAQSSVSYRPQHRYNQSYRGTNYTNEQPRGLGLV